MPYTVKLAWHLVVHLIGSGDIDLVVFMLTGQSNFATTQHLSLPIFEGRQFCAAVVERRDSPSWLCDEDDAKDDYACSHSTHDTLHLTVQVSDDNNTDNVLPVRSNGRSEDRVGVDEVFKITKFEQNDCQLIASECIC